MSLKCIVKEANLKKLPNVQFYLYNIPEKKKKYRNSKQSSGYHGVWGMIK